MGLNSRGRHLRATPARRTSEFRLDSQCCCRDFRRLCDDRLARASGRQFGRQGRRHIGRHILLRRLVSGVDSERKLDITGCHCYRDNHCARHVWGARLCRCHRGSGRRSPLHRGCYPARALSPAAQEAGHRPEIALGARIRIYQPAAEHTDVIAAAAHATRRSPPSAPNVSCPILVNATDSRRI